MSYLPRPKALVLAYGVFALALLTYCLSTAVSKPPGQDEDPEYPSVEGLADIVTLYEAEQGNWLPMFPPGTQPWLQTANPGVLQFKPKDFPKEFTDNLIPIEQYGVYVYPIIVFEHPATRARVFYNSNQEQIASVPAPPGYDPLWYLLQAYGQEYLDQLPPGKRQELIQTFDPSRLWSLFKLIRPQDLATYIENKQIANLPGPGIEMTMGEGGESNLEFTAVNVTNGYLEFEIRYPTNSLTSIDVFLCTNLIEGYWWVYTNFNAEYTNCIAWVDDQTSNNLHRIFHCGDAVQDDDPGGGDGLVDSHELIIWGTSIDTNDSDGDTITDYDEVITYDTDPNNSDTNTPDVTVVFPTNGYQKIWIP